LFRLQAANLDRLHPAGIQNGNGEQSNNGFAPLASLIPTEKVETVKD